MAWFELNRVDKDANKYLYAEIPLYYTFEKDLWKKRQRNLTNIIPRMYTVTPNDRERFYLRMLLLHVKGARHSMT